MRTPKFYDSVLTILHSNAFLLHYSKGFDDLIKETHLTAKLILKIMFEMELDKKQASESALACININVHVCVFQIGPGPALFPSIRARQRSHEKWDTFIDRTTEEFLEKFGNAYSLDIVISHCFL